MGFTITCSQFLFGSEYYFVDDAFKNISADPGWIRVKVSQGEPVQAGDVIFYFSAMINPIHVGVVDHDGQVVSKFWKSEVVIRHEIGDGGGHRQWSYIVFRQIEDTPTVKE